MRGTRAGVEQLHSLGFAHNDLNPMNIALDKEDQPMTLHFGSCRNYGVTLLSGGTSDWIHEDYSVSAVTNDKSALRKLDLWLREKQAEFMRELCHGG